MEYVKQTVVGTLEGVKDKLEQNDQNLAKRQRYFGAPDEPSAADQSSDSKESTEIPKGVSDEQNPVKFKQVGLELLNIGIYYGEKGVDTVKSLPVYQKVDAYVNFDDKFDLVRKHGEQLYTMINNKLRPIYEHVFFLYNATNNRITSYVNVITVK